MQSFSHHTIPVINTQSVNSTTPCRDKHYLSFSQRTSDYGCVTTAIVMAGRLFFVLNGDHRQALDAISLSRGLQGCFNYFLEHLGEASIHSEHRIVAGEKKDLFGLTNTALETLGQQNIDRLTLACRSRH
ncbi:hypothetical protein D3C87_686460 [compost metagenome]